MVRSFYLSRLALFACCFAFAVIALGALTRLFDAGLGCPDWPGCYGHLTVTGAEQAGNALVPYKAWLEMAHRYFVGALSGFLLLIILSIFSLRSLHHRANFILATVLLVLLGYQILLGRWTVTLKLIPMIVSQHLLGGFCILSILWLLYLIHRPQKEYWALKQERKCLAWAILAVLLVFLQISLGAWTSTNYAALSCHAFPICQQGSLMHWQFKEAFQLFRPLGLNYEGGVLSESARQTIQMTHRFGALIVTSYLFIFSSIAMQMLKGQPQILRAIYPVLAFLLIQVCLGISNVIFQLPLATGLAHNLVAVSLLLALINVVYQIAVLKQRSVSL